MQQVHRHKSLDDELLRLAFDFRKMAKDPNFKVSDILGRPVPENVIPPMSRFFNAQCLLELTTSERIVRYQLNQDGMAMNRALLLMAFQKMNLECWLNLFTSVQPVDGAYLQHLFEKEILTGAARQMMVIPPGWEQLAKERFMLDDSDRLPRFLYDEYHKDSKYLQLKSEDLKADDVFYAFFQAAFDDFHNYSAILSMIAIECILLQFPTCSKHPHLKPKVQGAVKQAENITNQRMNQTEKLSKGPSTVDATKSRVEPPVADSKIPSPTKFVKVTLPEEKIMERKKRHADSVRNSRHAKEERIAAVLRKLLERKKRQAEYVRKSRHAKQERNAAAHRKMQEDKESMLLNVGLKAAKKIKLDGVEAPTMSKAKEESTPKPVPVMMPTVLAKIKPAVEELVPTPKTDASTHETSSIVKKVKLPRAAKKIKASNEKSKDNVEKPVSLIVPAN